MKAAFTSNGVPDRDDRYSGGQADGADHVSSRRAPQTRGKPRPVTAPEDWRVNVERRSITHLKSGLVLKMRRGIQRGEQMAIPTNLERMPRWGTRWPRALREAEALYHAALAAQHERQPGEPGEGV
jgi:hypothetical protein